MGNISDALVKSLSLGEHRTETGQTIAWDPVGRLARVYEIARNALEYRADHLVRRAAIERILRRQMLFQLSEEKLAEELILELKWARYVSEAEIRELTIPVLGNILKKYIQAGRENRLNKDWLVGLASAEVEEKINPNRDYQQFTTFAYHVMKKRLKLPDIPYLDLVLFTCVDRVYSQSDKQQLAFHLWKLIRNQTGERRITQEQILEETWKHFNLAINHKLQNSLGSYIRQQMPPLVLIRDMYFSDPRKFAQVVNHEKEFYLTAREVLNNQLGRLRKRMNTATVRSLIYVFLTKMLIVILLEIPLENIVKGHVSTTPLLINLAFPVALMWYLSARIRLPSAKVQQALVSVSWKVVQAEQYPVDETDMYWGPRPVSTMKISVYYLLYAILFMVTFTAIGYGLTLVGFGVFNITIFILFLCVVTFFAYRIRQTALVYTYKPREQQKTAFSEIVTLPVVVVGSWLSREVSRLNFLVFIFDFILEAPFKIILRFLDSWMAFLSVKRDEAVG